MKSWYVVRTQVRKENEAKQNLIQQGFTAYLPTFNREIKHARKVTKKTEALFPGYLFLQLSPEQRRWTTIRSTRGVVDVVHFGLHYPHMTNEWMVQLQQGQIQDLVDTSVRNKEASRFQIGNHVRLTKGSMAGLMGTIVSLRGDQRVVLLLDMLSRQVKSEIPMQMIRLVS